MRKKSSSVYIVLGMAVLAAVGCSESNSARLDGDPATAELSIQAVSGSTAANRVGARLLTADGGIEVTSARLNVETVKIIAPDGIGCADLSFVESEKVKCEEELEDDGASELASAQDSSSDDAEDDSSSEVGVETEIKIEGPVVYDLFTGASTPEVNAFSLPSGIFKKLKLELHEAEDDDGILDAGDPLMDHTLVAAGTYEDANGASVPFSLAVTFTAKIEIKNPDGFEVLEGGVNTIIAELDVQEWFVGVDLAQCVADGNLSLDGSGTLVIDENLSGSGDCSDIKGTIKQNIQNSFDMKAEHEDDESDDSEDDSSSDSEGVDA